MDLSKIKPINLYQLSLLNVEYIDFDNSVICNDGTVNIMLDTQKIPKPTFAVNIDDWVFENLSDSDECYIKFNPEQGIAEGLYVECYAVMHKYDFVYVATLFFMRELNHPEYIKYANMYDEFNSKVMEWLKSRIRDIVKNPKGEFVSDKIDQDTYFQWYGVLPESAITIKLTDVADDGREVFIPDENRTITIDDEEVADYFAEYRQKTGFKRPRLKEESPYTQITFYRNTSKRGDAITVKTIYNIRQKFITLCEDKRFAKKRIYWSGRYAEMFKTEMKMDSEFSTYDSESVKIIGNIFNDEEITYDKIASLLREYAVFKKDCIERL